MTVHTQAPAPALSDDEIASALASRGTSESPAAAPPRQPVHTVYGGAHLFKPDVVAKLGAAAVRALDEFAPDAASFARAFRLEGDLAFATRVRARTAEKLGREPIEDLRVDFEDGYGPRSDDEEDGHAAQVGAALAAGARSRSLPARIGIRVKAPTGPRAARGLRTLARVLESLGRHGPALFPEGFVVTLPKASSEREVAVLVDVLATLEARLSLPRIPIELMIEHPSALGVSAGSTVIARMIDAAAGRVRGVHFGAYDYTAACDVAARDQDLLHPACDFARHAMIVALANTSIELSDGATTVMPIGPHKTPASDLERDENRAAVHAAWSLHVRHVRHSLRSGFHQGWDLHPAQLVSRHATVIAYYLEGLSDATARLDRFLGEAARASRVGTAFDDAATGQGLLNFFARGIDCGALDDADLAAAGLTAPLARARDLVAIIRARRPS